MDSLIVTTRSSSRNNKYQIWDSFRTDEKKGENSSPRMGWFRASGTVEILMYVDRLSRGDPNKYNLIGELNFKIAYV